MSILSHKTLVFDLDDTLFDTTKYLIPRAVDDCCQAIANHLTDDSEFNANTLKLKREEIIINSPRASWIEELVLSHITPKKQSLALEAGNSAFYAREVPPDIHLDPLVIQFLQMVSRDHLMALVTQGDKNTQTRKVEILKLAQFFPIIRICDPLIGEHKAKVFEQIETTYKLSPPQTLSIGNRIDTDLVPAKLRGWKTCLIKRGEGQHIAPRQTAEKPDYVLSSVCDILNI